MRSAIDRLDHLVYATPDLDVTVRHVEDGTGVRATPGGHHQGRGTRNALVSLSENSYLEIIGPDPQQPRPANGRWFGIDSLRVARLVAWAVHSRDVDGDRRHAQQHGVTLGALGDGSRQTPNGDTLRWRFTDPSALVDDGLIPFLIDWSSTPHPALSAAQGAELVSLRAEAPEAARIAARLGVMGIRMDVASATQSSLVAELRGPGGTMVLR